MNAETERRGRALREAKQVLGPMTTTDSLVKIAVFILDGPDGYLALRRDIDRTEPESMPDEAMLIWDSQQQRWVQRVLGTAVAEPVQQNHFEGLSDYLRRQAPGQVSSISFANENEAERPRYREDLSIRANWYAPMENEVDRVDENGLPV